MDCDLERHLSGQSMGGTSKAGIVGAKCHLDHVQQSFGHLAFLDQTRRGLVRGHLNRRIIIGRTDDEIRLGHDAALIGPVMVREGAARRLDNSNSFSGNLSRFGVNVR